MPSETLGLISLLPAWLLVLFRISGIFVFAPVLGSSTVPGRIKVLWAVGMSFVVFPMLLSPGRPAAGFVMDVAANGLYLWAIAGQIAGELLIGLVIGYGASLPLIGFQIGGRVIDQQLGIGLAGVFNPDLDDQSGITGEFLFLTALAIFVILGGHRMMVMVLVGSFDHVPLGVFSMTDGLLVLLVGLLQAMFDVALRVAGPLLCIIFLETVALGFIARTVPQMNILSVGFPLRILAGFALLVGAIAVQGEVLIDAIRFNLNSLTHFFTGGMNVHG